MKKYFIEGGLGSGFSGIMNSFSSYWSHQSEVLFFGLYSEISGGQMPNKVTGATDFLTVAGAVGSETYQCPNTAAYIAADTDYIWFKTDTTQRTTTTAELIGYDLQRTPVKYDDTAPNAIIAIMILKAGEVITGTKRDKMFTDFWLPVMWDNSLSAYGRIKDNRGATQQLWTPESILDDDATAFINVAGITDDTQEAALHELCIDLKAASFWTPMKAIYPIIGGSAATHKWNLKDPQDTDGAFRLTFAGGLTHSATGILPNGTTGVASTKFTSAAFTNVQKGTLGFYSRTNDLTGTRIAMGQLNFDSSAINQINIGNGNGILGHVDAIAAGTVTDGSGFFVITRRTSTDISFYQNGGVVANSIVLNAKTVNDALYDSGSFDAGEEFILLFARNGAAGAHLFDNKECSLAFIYDDGMSDAQVLSLNTIVEKYQDALSRGVQ